MAGSDTRTRWLPVVAIVLASICFSALALCVRELSLAGVPSFEIVLFRSAAQVAVSVLILLWAGQPWRTWLGENLTEVKWLSLRGLLGFGGVGFNFLGISYLPLAESQVLSTMVPVYAPILAWLMLGEEWYATEMVSTMLGIVGVLLIARPAAIFGDDAPMAGQSSADNSVHNRGVVCCMASSFCLALTFVVVRLLGTRVKVHWATVMLCQALWQVGLAAVCLVTLQKPSMLTTWMLWVVIAAGLVGSVGQAFNTWGMQREKSATASIVQKGLTPFAGFFNQVVFLPGDPVYWATIAGFCVTGVSLVVVSVGKFLRERAEDEQAKEPEGYLPLLSCEASAVKAARRCSNARRGGA